MSADAAGEVVLALAGHVDHGKSALVGALTGQATDRRREEQARGLTVDLAHLVLAGDRAMAVTDAPGHVDYLANTVAGLGGATHALLVVAADDGWMPQTEDHVRAARHLGVPIALAVVSKVDLVDDDRVATVADDVRARLATTGTPPAIVRASTRDGRGVDEVREHLGRLHPPGTADDAPRLWIDRAFRVEGRGLVVTGTLATGRLAVGEAVTVAPDGTTGRIRGLQRHGRVVDVVVAPGRVAANVADAPAQRGDRLMAGRLGRRAPATDALDAWLWSDLPDGIGERGAWTLHAGSGHVEAQVLPVERDPVVAGAHAAVHLRLARALPLVQGDRFVVRDVGRRVVAGGGVVLDPRPAVRSRGTAARRARATALAGMLDADDRVAALVDAEGGAVARARVVAATGMPDPARDVVAGHVVTAAWWDRVATAVTDLLAGAGPDGLLVDDVAAGLADRVGVPVAVAREALGRLPDVARRDRRIVPAARREELDAARARALAALHDRLRATPLAPEPLEDLARATGVPAADVDRLVRDGQVVRSGPYGFLPPAVDVVVGRLRALPEGAGGFTVADARDALGITRKHAVPWLELLDRLGLTVRDGDRRRLSPSAESTRPDRPRTGR
jgi:selenocysteine-specific elongation factor